MDAIDARDWPGLADELGDLMLQAVFYRADGVRSRALPHRRFARRHQQEAHPPPSAHFRRLGRADGRRCEEALGRDQGGGEEGQGRAARSCCSKAFRDRCRRWWKRRRSAPAPPAPASTGRMPSRCSTSSTRNCTSSPRPGSRRRTKRSKARSANAVRAGQSRAIREGRSRAGAAQEQREVPAPLRACREVAAASAARSSPNPNIQEMEELWQEAKRSE